MAYDEALAERVRAALASRAEFEERKMFGGLAFMVHTHMACGIIGGDLMVRVGKDRHDDAIHRGAREMDFTGRPMRGLVIVPGETLDDDPLWAWIDEAAAFALAEPPKAPKTPKPRRTPRS